MMANQFGLEGELRVVHELEVVQANLRQLSLELDKMTQRLGDVHMAIDKMARDFHFWMRELERELARRSHIIDKMDYSLRFLRHCVDPCTRPFVNILCGTCL